jgi:hypothetical protein
MWQCFDWIELPAFGPAPVSTWCRRWPARSGVFLYLSLCASLCPTDQARQDGKEHDAEDDGSESPGRNGMTTTPVSMKITANNIA